MRTAVNLQLLVGNAVDHIVMAEHLGMSEVTRRVKEHPLAGRDQQTRVPSGAGFIVNHRYDGDLRRFIRTECDSLRLFRG